MKLLTEKIRKPTVGVNHRARQYVTLRRHHAALKGATGGNGGAVELPHYIRRVGALEAGFNAF